MARLTDRAFSVSVVDRQGKVASGAIVRVYRDGKPKQEGNIQDGPFLVQSSAPDGKLEVEVFYGDFYWREEVEPSGSPIQVLVPDVKQPMVTQAPPPPPLLEAPIPRISWPGRYKWAIAGISAVILVLIAAANIGWIHVIDRSPFDIHADYIGPGPHTKPVAVVLVHGIFGSSNDTWNNRGNSFPALLANDPEFQGQVDVFLYEYFTPKFGSAASIVGLADQLRGSLDDHHVFEDHRDVIFLSHSMGGLIVREFLLTNRDRLSKVPMLYFYATPTNGSELTTVAREISSNPQLRGMLPLEGNDLLQAIQSGWLGWDAMKKIPSYCAYETMPTYGVFVVSMSSATALCNQALDPISANHIDIVKPRDRQDPRYTRFTSALRSSIAETVPTQSPANQ